MPQALEPPQEWPLVREQVLDGGDLKQHHRLAILRSISHPLGAQLSFLAHFGPDFKWPLGQFPWLEQPAVWSADGSQPCGQGPVGVSVRYADKRSLSASATAQRAEH